MWDAGPEPARRFSLAYGGGRNGTGSQGGFGGGRAGVEGGVVGVLIRAMIKPQRPSEAQSEINVPEPPCAAGFQHVITPCHVIESGLGGGGQFYDLSPNAAGRWGSTRRYQEFRWPPA